MRYLFLKGSQIIKWLFFLFIYLLSSTLVSVAGEFPNHPDRMAQFLGIGLISSAISLGFIGWRYWVQLQENNPRHFGKYQITWQKVSRLFLLFAAMLVLQYLWSLLISLGVLNFPANQQAVDVAANQMPFWNNLFAIAVAPFFEELIFRGIFLNYFFAKETKWNNFFGILVSGLLFGLGHEPSFDSTLLMYSAMGWLLGLTYLHFRDIRFNTALHIMNNLLTVI